MNCESVEDGLAQFLLGELDPESSHRIREHLASGCRGCNAQYQELQAAVDQLYSSLPRSHFSAIDVDAIHAQVLDYQPSQNILTTPPSKAVLPVESHTQRGIGLGWQALLCSSAFAAGIAIMVFLSATSEITPGELNRHVSINDETSAAQSPTESSSDGASDPVIVFTSIGLNQDAPAVYQKLYDPANQEVHFFGQNFSPPPSGDSYYLAIEGLGGELELVQAFEVDSFGSGRAIITNVSASRARQLTIVLQAQQ